MTTRLPEESARLRERTAALGAGLGRARHRFSLFTAAATFVLIFVGGLVTSTGSSLSVPDWPLSYGQFFPPLVGGVLYEHGHRMVAGAVALLTLALAVWTCREEPRAWARRLAVIALAAVVLQAILGGVTVLLRLPTAVSVAHAALAQAFFCLVVTLALVTGPDWVSGTPLAQRDAVLQASSVATTASVYVQLLVGAVTRHTGAGLAIPDFPLAYGRLVPDLASFPVAIHFAHRVGALVVSALVLATATRVLAARRRDPRLTRPALLLLALVVLQLSLGASVVWTRKAALPTTAHVAIGAAILATTLVIALRSLRDGAASGAWLAHPSAQGASA
ncbi:MAG: heme A synthase [Deltaproteobacteria bacterium]|nr:heme A synthase [Deltaproteobacteria bacterium]